jgi:hypothetical protein
MINETVLESTLFHELLHMASTNYDEATNNIYSGLEIISDDKVLNYYLNEGFTELMTINFYPESHNYKDVTNIANIITNIIGIDKVKDIYFYANKSSLDLQEYLSKITDGANIKLLFSNIEGIYNRKQKNDIDNYNFALQSSILSGLMPFLKDAIKSGIDSKIFNSKKEIDNYYNKRIKPHLENLINMMKMDEINTSIFTNELKENCYDNFSDLFDDFVIPNKNNLGHVSIYNILMIVIPIILLMSLTFIFFK